MSFLNHFQLKDFQFAIVEQTALNLNAIALLPEEQQQINKLQHSKRKVEFLGVRHLRNLFEIKEAICYAKSGKPYLKDDSKHISISHCPGFMSLAVAPYPIGIDIESMDRDATRIINKFTIEDEKVLCATPLKTWFLELWCAKEAVYKLYDLSGLSFKDEIRIKERSETENGVLLLGSILRQCEHPDFEVRIVKNLGLVQAVAIFRDKP